MKPDYELDTKEVQDFLTDHKFVDGICNLFTGDDPWELSIKAHIEKRLTLTICIDGTPTVDLYVPKSTKEALDQAFQLAIQIMYGRFALYGDSKSHRPLIDDMILTIDYIRACLKQEMLLKPLAASEQDLPFNRYTAQIPQQDTKIHVQVGFAPILAFYPEEDGNALIILRPHNDTKKKQCTHLQLKLLVFLTRMFESVRKINARKGTPYQQTLQYLKDQGFKVTAQTPWDFCDFVLDQGKSNHQGKAKVVASIVREHADFPEMEFRFIVGGNHIAFTISVPHDNWGLDTLKQIVAMAKYFPQTA
jgi:hypothetical protein